MLLLKTMPTGLIAKTFHALRRSIEKTPKSVLLGVVAVILMYLGSAGIISTAVPWNIGGDTRAHIDYVWRINQGDIPKFYDGLTYPPVVGMTSKAQQAAANPPLFYVLHAPFLRESLNSGSLNKGVAIGRAINLVIGVSAILTLAWLAWLVGGRYRELLAVGAPAVIVLSYRFLTLNVIFGLDALLLTLIALTLVALYKVMTKGARHKYMLSLVILVAAGMLTKAPYVFILPVLILGILFRDTLLKKPVKFRKEIIKNVALAALVPLAALIASGWFYYNWNYMSSGRWFSAAPPEYTTGREYKSLSDVLTNSATWGLFYEGYIKPPILSVAFTSFGVAGLLFLKKKQIKDYLADRIRLKFSLLLLLLLLGVFSSQIILAVGYGSVNARYMLPGIFPIAGLLVVGLLQYRWMRGQFVTFFATIMGIAAFLPVASSRTVMSKVPTITEGSSSIAKIFAASSHNGVPVLVTLGLFISFILGTCFLARSLFQLTATLDD